jgi:hypothetical protein
MKRIALTALLSLLAAGAGAGPVKCVDASGKIRYVDESLAGEEKCQPVKDSMNIVAPQSQPGGAARFGSGARPEADTRVADAEAKLADAKSKLAEQEATRVGGERNYARVLERLKPYQDEVERAEQELEQARRDSRR